MKEIHDDNLLKVLTWNIRNGGAKNCNNTINAILKHQADLIVLTEYKNKNKIQLSNAFQGNGYGFVVTSNPEDKENGIFVASKIKIDYVENIEIEHDKQRWLSLYIPEYDVYVLAVHIPSSDDHKFVDGFGVSGKHRKKLFWEKVVEYAAHHSQNNSIIIGDFNTGLEGDAEGTPFTFSEYMRDIIKIGYVDAWRKKHNKTKEYTWYSQHKVNGVTEDKNGFRLDYIFVSPKYATNIFDAYHSHEERITIFQTIRLL